MQNTEHFLEVKNKLREQHTIKTLINIVLSSKEHFTVFAFLPPKGLHGIYLCMLTCVFHISVTLPVFNMLFHFV